MFKHINIFSAKKIYKSSIINIIGNYSIKAKNKYVQLGN